MDKWFDEKRRDFKKYFMNGVGGLCQLKEQDKGMALVTVIIVIAVLALIATTLANVSVFSFQRKSMDYESRENFYNVETCVDDIRVGLQHKVAECMGDIAQPQLYAQNLKKALRTTDETKAMMQGWIASDLIINGEEANVVSVGGISLDEAGTSVIISDVRIEYIDLKGNYSAVETDFVMEAPPVRLPNAYGSYATIAGSGMNLTGGGNGYTLEKNGGTNIVASIYVGNSNISTASVKNLPNGWSQTSWNSVNIPAGKCVTYSGDNVTFNGNLVIGKKAVVRFEGQEVTIRGYIILEDPATLVIEEHTKLECAGIKVKTGSGTSLAYTDYVGTAAKDSALSAIKIGNNYYGHIPFTYPYVEDFTWSEWALGNYADSNFVTGQGDTSAYEVYSNCIGGMNNFNGNKTICYAHDTNNSAFWESGYYDSDKYCCMTDTYAGSLVLVGTKCNFDSGYYVYPYADKFTWSAGNTSVGNGDYSKYYSNSQSSTTLPYNYSGVAYPVTYNASTKKFTAFKYGKTAPTTVSQEAVSNITVDPAKCKPEDNVPSKYEDSAYLASSASQSYRNTSASGNGRWFQGEYYDPIVYGFIEPEFAYIYGSNRLDSHNFAYPNNAGTFTLGSSAVSAPDFGKTCGSINVGNTEEMRVFMCYDSVIFNANTSLKAFSFCARDLTVKNDGRPLIIQSAISNQELAQVSAYVTEYAAHNGDKSYTYSAAAQAGKTIKDQYEAWGALYTPFDTGKDSSDHSFLYSDMRQGKLGSSTSGYTTSLVQFPHSMTDSSIQYPTTISDWFKGGVESLYLTEEQSATLDLGVNKDTFSVVRLANWRRL